MVNVDSFPHSAIFYFVYSMCGHSNLANNSMKQHGVRDFGIIADAAANRIHYKFNFHKNHINCQLELWTVSRE